ncbi:acyl carrier protein [Sphingomonas sp. NFX23]
MSDLADRARKIVADHFSIEVVKATDDTSFIEDLGADSLDIVEIVIAFEEEFDIEIPDEATEMVTTIEEAISYIVDNLPSHTVDDFRKVGASDCQLESGNHSLA